MNESTNWFCQPANWKDETLKLLLEGFGIRILSSKYETILQNSEDFPKAPVEFATNSVRCKYLEKLVDKSILQRNIESVYPVMHENTLHLCAEFLLFKRNYGSTIEKQLYKNMSLNKFIERLLNKKAILFVNKCDIYILKNGSIGHGNWETIGTETETAPLILENCLSYDELKISPLISISSYSYFINDGSRIARGRIADRDKIEEEGIIISIIGPRLQRKYVHDYPEIIINEYQNTFDKIYAEYSASSLRRIFDNFYEEKLLTFQDALLLYNKYDRRFNQFSSEDIFDNTMYEKRLTVTFDTLLLEANKRAKNKEMKAYIHVVGTSLGMWSVSEHQEQIFVKAFGKRLRILGAKLQNVSDVNLSYFPMTYECADCKNGEVLRIDDHPTGIKIHISKREPHSILTGEDEGKLLVVSYAGDGNSMPGDEFWFGCMGNSSDSAMASSSQISELHNPHINPMVTAKNLMIATCHGSVITVQEYVARFKNGQVDEYQKFNIGAEEKILN